MEKCYLVLQFQRDARDHTYINSVKSHKTMLLKKEDTLEFVPWISYTAANTNLIYSNVCFIQMSSLVL